MKQSILLLLCLFSVNFLFAQDNITIRGKVLDAENGQALIGASLQIKGTNNGTQTDIDGNFSIVAPANETLVVNYVGYQKQEVPINGQTLLNIRLRPETTQLDQVVVVGYGTQEKKEVTGSISSVKGEDIARQASQNPVSSLQGRVAGVQITNSGAPGASPQVRIRGTGSAFGGVEPLYVVDGIFVNDLSFLNPNDIESIDILKDASSASIYGIRAANGVVLVTTKKGKAGSMKVEYNGFVGAQIVTNRVPMASALKYAVLVNEKTGSPTVREYPTTNWYDQILRPVALVHNHQWGITGGTEKSIYSFSLGYLNQEGAVRKNEYNKLTARLQNDIQVSKNVKVGYNALLYNYNSIDIPGSIFYQAYVAPPIMAVRREDGRYGDPADYNVGNFANPQASLDWFNQRSKGQSLTSTAYGEVNFLKNFTFRSSFGLNLGFSEFRNYVSQDSLTSIQFAHVSRLNKETSKSRRWLWENTLVFDRSFGDHKVKTLLGYSAQEDRFESIGGSIANVPYYNEGSLNLSLGDPTTATLHNGAGLNTVMSYFGRLNYSFKDRYLLTASIRRDGSSKFPKESRFDNFPSVGAGWIISNEPFMADQRIFDLLKLRASWGKLGNENIPANIAVQTISTGGLYNYYFGGVHHIGSNNTVRVSPTLFWEVVKETDFGAEMGFLNNRLTLELDYYNKLTDNAIFDVPILGSLGTSNNSIRGNFASFRNAGFEMAATWRNQVGNLNYNIGANGSFNKNTVVSISTGDNPLYSGGLPVGGYLTTISRIGSPIGAFYGYVVDGIFQTEQEVTNSAQPSAKPGYFRYRDLNNDGVIDNKDKTIIGNPNPRFTYGITSGVQYKSFDLQLDIQGVAGVEIYNATKGVRYGNENYTLDFYQNRWHGPGTSNTYPSADLSGPNLDPNTWFVEKGDYIRLRNVQLGYTLNNRLTSALKIQKLRLYLNAQNPITYFRYKGFTPEVGGSPTSAGIDLNVYPLSATYNAGLNITF